MINKTIQRTLSAHLQKAITQPHILALLGARQVGKTTLLAQLLPPLRTLHVTFDSGELRERILANEDYLLRLLEEFHQGPLTRDGLAQFLCIDEAQKLPEAFDIIKQLHDRFSPGLKIILSGSSTLLIRKHTAETLAGRIRFFQLDPFSLREACDYVGLPLAAPSDHLELMLSGQWKDSYLKKYNLAHRHLEKKFRTWMIEWCLWGLFPPRFHLDGESEWALFFRDYVDTYIEKDMRATERIGGLGDYRKLVRVMGDTVGGLVNYSKIASSVGIHRETVRDYLQILDESLLGFRLPAYSESIHRRVAKSEKSFLIDNGLAYYFMDLRPRDVIEASGKMGSLYENLIISELIKQSRHLSAPAHHYYWRLSGANPPEVDLICEYRGNVVPVEIKTTSNPDKSDLRGLRAFMSAHKDKANIHIPYGVLIYQGEYRHLPDDRIFCLPDWMLV